MFNKKLCNGIAGILLSLVTVIVLTSCNSNAIKSVTYTNGTYVGQLKDGVRDGKGTYTYNNGSKYVGGFKDGVKVGTGTFTYVSGDKYVGEFKNDLRDGMGTYTYDNGDNM